MTFSLLFFKKQSQISESADPLRFSELIPIIKKKSIISREVNFVLQITFRIK